MKLPLKRTFRRLRYKMIRLWRFHAAIPRLLRYNPYTGFIGRKFLKYIPFLLPHEKSYYGFAHLVREGDGLFLDVGANDGISAFGFRHIHSDYRILSIEPNPCHEPCLRKVKQRLKRFDYKIIGAGSKRSQLTLYIPASDGVPIYSSASLRKECAQEAMAELNFLIAQEKHIVFFECKVDIVPLDDLHLEPDIIKIDTEGFEYEVLLGLDRTIKKFRPPVMVEYSACLMGEIRSFFNRHEYGLWTYDYARDRFLVFDEDKEKSIFQKQKIKTNIFCVPREKEPGLPRSS